MIVGPIIDAVAVMNTEVCSPGTFSADGLTPCRPCPVGTYQSDHGRTLCLPCGPGVLTRDAGSTGFHDCLVHG